MKKNTILTAALISLGLVSRASADNIIYLTGSTAFRAQVQTALGNNAGGTAAVFDSGTIDDVACYGNAASSKALYALFHGKIGGVATYIDCFWGGSEQGIAAVAGNTSQTLNDGAPLAGVPATFLVPSTTSNPTVTTASLPTGSELNSSPTVPADLDFSDTSQAVSLTPPVGNNALTSYGICSIVPFIWMKGTVNSADGAWSRFTDMQTYQANELFANGTRTADFFNSGVAGGAADFDHTVYVIGRNKGSGTRANYLLAAQYPVGTPVIQWSVNSTAGVNPSTGLPGLYFVGAGLGSYTLGPIPHLTVGGNSDTDDADDGYESGGDVDKALTFTAPTTGYVPSFSGNDGNSALTVGFLGIPDSGAAASGTLPAQYLTYNGVGESDGAIESGAYLCWGHEHIYGKHTPTNPAATALVPILFKALKSQFDNNDTAVGNSTYEGANWNDAVDPATLHSAGIYPFYMVADRGTTSSDSGFPVTGDAFGLYTWYGSGANQ